MYRERVIDCGQMFDYGRTSPDYARFRPGPPQEYYDRLEELGIGASGQRVLDIGTGTGAIARALARRGAIVSAFDISAAQIAHARKLAANEKLSIDFQVGAAEDPPKFMSQSFDVAIGNQCFLYLNTFRVTKVLSELVVPRGHLVVSHFRRLASDPVVHASEQLVRKYNSKWEGAGFDGGVEPFPEWVPKLPLRDFFWFDIDIAFSRDSWRGRMRASRGVGATLPEKQVRQFDSELAELLEVNFPELFTVKHRIDVRILIFP
jgi:SAM-dependent methyltransferase